MASKKVSDGVLDASPWAQGASRPNFMALASRPALIIFSITVKLMQDNKLILVIIITIINL